MIYNIKTIPYFTVSGKFFQVFLKIILPIFEKVYYNIIRL